MHHSQSGDGGRMASPHARRSRGMCCQHLDVVQSQTWRKLSQDLQNMFGKEVEVIS